MADLKETLYRKLYNISLIVIETLKPEDKSVEKNFPSILKEDISEGIVDISYSIELNNCAEFKCNNNFII